MQSNVLVPSDLSAICLFDYNSCLSSRSERSSFSALSTAFVTKTTG